MKYYIKEIKKCVYGKSRNDNSGIFIVDFDTNKLYPIGCPNYNYATAADKLKNIVGYNNMNIKPFWEYNTVEDKLNHYCKILRLDTNFDVTFEVLTEDEAFLEMI